MYVFFVSRDPDDAFPHETITADDAIDIVVGAVLLGSKRLRAMTKNVLKAQRRLHRAVDDDGWKAYLRLEELLNERASAQMDLLLRWALGHGSRSRRGR